MRLPILLAAVLALGLSACVQRPTAPGPAAPALPGPLTARQSSYPDKAAPVAGDKVLITDSEALNAPKQVSLGAIADLAGLPTTCGSPILASRIAPRSDLTVARLQRQGAIPLAKSNVPEFAGANTFNTVFGATRNPWNPALTAGGSSGAGSSGGTTKVRYSTDREKV